VRFILFMLFSVSAWAWPGVQYSDDGRYWRLHNPDDRPYYCWVMMGDGREVEKILYAHSTTSWYSTHGDFIWECSE